MAGDWNPLRDNIHDDPDVYAMAAALKVKDSDLIVGKLTRFWAWASQHSADGNLTGATLELIDRVSHQRGFGAAMLAVGWLVNDGHKFIVPKFDRWMSRGAKARLGEAKRKQMSRGAGGSCPDKPPELSGQMSGQMSGQKRDHRTVQDRTEEKTSTPLAVSAPIVPPTAGIASATGSANRFLADRQVRTGNAPAGFVEFYNAYPTGFKSGRDGLLAMWNAQGLETESQPILDGLAAWIECERWREGFIVEARKFIETRKWLDHPPPPKPKASADPKGLVSADDAVSAYWARQKAKGVVRDPN